MGNIDHCRLEFIVQSGKLDAHLGAERSVQIGKGFVKQKHPRLTGDRASNRNALALSARQRFRFAIQQMVNMQRPRSLHHGHINFCLCLIGQLQSERHVLVQRHVWIKRIGLEDHRNAPLGRWHIVHAYSIDENIACVDVLKSRNHSQQCRLATA